MLATHGSSFVGSLSSTLALLCGVLLVYGGVRKAVALGRFRDTLSALELFPRSGATISAPMIVVGELAIAAGLLAGTPLAAWTAIGMILSFTVALAVYRLRGGTLLRCGCFGDFEHPRPTSHAIARNVALLAALLMVALVPTPAMVAFGAAELLIMGTSVGLVIVLWTSVLGIVEILRLYLDERRGAAIQIEGLHEH